MEEKKRKTKKKCNFVQAYLNIVNSVLICISLVLIGMSLMFLIVYQKDFAFFHEFQRNITILLILIGIGSLAIGLAGIYAINTTDLLMMTVLISAMFFVFLLLVGVGIWTFLAGRLDGSLLKNVHNDFNQTLLDYNELNTESPQQQKLDYFQAEFKCCGWNSYMDWRLAAQMNEFKPYLQYKFLLGLDQIEINVPDACCVVYYPSCGKDYSLNKTIFNHGCKNALIGLLDHFRWFVFSMTLTMAISYALSALVFILVLTIIASKYNIISIYKSDVSTVESATSSEEKQFISDEEDKSLGEEEESVEVEEEEKEEEDEDEHSDSDELNITVEKIQK